MVVNALGIPSREQRRQHQPPFVYCMTSLLFFAVTSAAGSVSLTGIGATFPAEVYESWMPAFQYHRSQFVANDLEYHEVGSKLGTEELLGVSPGSAVYAGTDAVLTSEEKEHDLLQVPVVAGAVVLAYNLPSVSKLTLSRDAVVAIYNGSVRFWNDPLLQALNAHAHLPAAAIRVVVRADDCGTTEIFTSALTAFSAAWNATYGTFSEGVDDDEIPTRWAEGVPELFGRTNRGVAGIVYSYAFSLGYLSVAESRVGDLQVAALINRAGNAVSVRSRTTRDVMNERAGDFTDHLTCTLVDSPSPDAYPILGYSYFVIRKSNSTDCAAMMELYRYLEWILFDPYSAELAADRSFTQLTPRVTLLVRRRVLSELRCGGEWVESLVATQKNDEYWAQQTWQVPVVVLICVTGVLILGLIGYVGYQRVVLRRAITAERWYIPADDILVTLDQVKGWVSGVSGVSGTLSMASYAWPASVAKVGVWVDARVLVRRFPGCRHIRYTSTKTKTLILQWRTKMKDPNLLYCHGLTAYSGIPHIVSEFAQKGTLVDVLQNAKYQLCDNLKFSMATDVTSGMEFLHRQGVVHGRLSSHCCFVDARWNVKVADWELLQLAGDQPTTSGDADDVARGRMWTAPELILLDKVATPTRKSDVYSLSIVLVEVFSARCPYEEQLRVMEPQTLIQAVAKAGLRPNLNDLHPDAVCDVIRQCWDADPTRRPTLGHVTKVLLARRGSRRTVIEGLMETLEGYVTTLEERVQERTAELARVNRNLENLLHQILPPSVAGLLAAGHPVTPESYDSVSVFFSDVISFTRLCADSSPMEVVTFLNDLYVTFDVIVDLYDVYKVETIGDAYMVVSGLPERNGITHASSVVTMAQHFLRAVGTFHIRHKPEEKLRLRAGVHSGPVVAGVVGNKMPRYCVFGDTVNTASRMESTSLPMRIQISHTTYKLLTDLGGFEVTFRGETDIKGKETMPTYFLSNPDPETTSQNTEC